jgi:hypothetical protein
LSAISGFVTGFWYCIKDGGRQNGAQTWSPNTGPRKTRHKRQPIKPGMRDSRVLIYIFPKGLREACNFQGVKSDSKNEKRTKKMSIFRKPKGILEITICRTTLHHNALNCEKIYEKNVSIFLNINCRKGLGVFSVLLI